MAKITEDELDDIKERYDCYDKKGDGKIDTCQIIDVLRACGLNPLKPDVDKVKENFILHFFPFNSLLVLVEFPLF